MPAHDNKKEGSDLNNPCIQIMFNINSKNVVNNNILNQKQKDLRLELANQIKPQRIDKPFIYPTKKTPNEVKSKGKRTSLNNSNFSAYKMQDLSSQQTVKDKKKLKNQCRNKILRNSAQENYKMSNPKKSDSMGFVKVQNLEESLISAKKASTKIKSSLKGNKGMTQKIIELMIKDFESGKISGHNLKMALSSLIEKEAQQARVQKRTQIKSEKSRNSFKNSNTTSVRNTPKCKPTKSQSQKFCYKQSANLKDTSQFIEQKGQKQPEIIERIIEGKNFLNTITIKGINSSLFLSNEFTNSKQSPSKQTFEIKVINTSDSVKQLRKNMQNAVLHANFNPPISKNFKTLMSKKTQQKDQTQMDLSIQNDWKKEDTKKILQNLIEQLQFQYSDCVKVKQNQKNGSSCQNSFAFISNSESHDKSDNTKNYEQKSSLDQFYIREERSQSNNFEQKYFSDQNNDHQPQLNDKIVVQTNQFDQSNRKISQADYTIKSYVSSDLKSSAKNMLINSESQLHEMNQKRVKSIAETQIKKLNQLIKIIEDQIINQEPQSMNKKDTLENIVALLQKQRVNMEKELKIYHKSQIINQKEPNALNKNIKLTRNPQNYLLEESKYFQQSNQQKENLILESQIINSFKKKIGKNIAKDDFQSNFNPIVHFSDLKQISVASPKSFTSISTSSNHLEKTKISELNLDYIKIGLRKHLHDLQVKKQQQISVITEKFINDKISPKQYQQQKDIIEKWFQIESKKLKKIQRKLSDGVKQAYQFLEKYDENFLDPAQLKTKKSAKMMKCISQKYLQKNLREQQREQEQAKKQKKQRVVKDKKPLQKPTNLVIFPSNKQKNLSQIEQFQIEQSRKSSGNESIEYLANEGQFSKFSRSITPQYLRQFTRNTPQNSNDIVVGCRIQSQQSPKIYSSNESSLLKQKRSIQNALSNQNDAQQLNKQHRTEQRKKKFAIESQISQFLVKSEEKQNLDYAEQIDRYNEKEDNLEGSSESPINEVHYLGYDVDGDEDDYQELNDENYNFMDDLNQNDESNIPKSQSLHQEHPSELNIIVNRRSPSPDQIFSPKKPSCNELFSEQLEKYNQTSKQSQNNSLQFMNREFNQNYIKLKYLTEQDKDDIFQFMFLDLCLEIFLQQTKNNRIMKSIERHLIYLRKKKKIPKGFKTNLQTNKAYINNMSDYLQNNFPVILKRLQSPMGPSAKQMLKFMRDYDQSSSESSEIETVNLILPIQVYEKYELEPNNKLVVQKYYDDNDRQEARLKFLKSLKHFHNKAMFDSLNQMLDLERNYGIWGKPFPWKKVLALERVFSEQQLQQKLKRAQQKVIQNCSYLCGVMIDKEDSVFGKSNISQEYLHHIREDRMSKMLSNEMVDNEDRWIFYDDQETEVLVSISKSITALLVMEFLIQFKNLQQRSM